MPDNLNPNVESAEKATKRSAGRTARSRSPSAADEKSKPAGRKPRARKAPETVVVQASESAVVLGPAPEEAAVTVVAVQQAAEALDAVRARHYELIESVAGAERRVAELRRQADSLGDLSDLRREID